ncbi:MAG: methyl-accepting chemotaxis protein [Deltaproteobacteria bacterium]|nr:methyl-accepting chemotaxis protein [Deltaproteobacteria bacterium]
MNNPQFKRKNIFIKKRFQTDFSIRFLVLIVIESLLAIALFSYFSRGTIITGFSGSELIIESTRDYFLPTVIEINIAVIGVTAIAGFIVMLYASHKIAGPLYRFEKSLEEIGKGDLTHRFKLRDKDQMNTLAEKMNEFNSKMDSSIAAIQRDIEELKILLTELKSSHEREKAEALLNRSLKKLEELEKAAGHFRTTESLRR